MKKIIVAFTLICLSASSFAMQRAFNHPCLPLGFYKHAFGWMVKEAQLNPVLNCALLKFLAERKIILKRGPSRYVSGDHAYTMGKELIQNRMLTYHQARIIWQYGCFAQNIGGFAIRKNLGVSPNFGFNLALVASGLDRLFEYEVWPVNIVTEKEMEARLKHTYPKYTTFESAMHIEEKTANMVMKHFLEHPDIIQQKHIVGHKN